MIKQIAMVATLGLILTMVTTISSQSYVKKASASSESCPAGQVKDWAGICFNKSEARVCITCAPGSAAASEKPTEAATEKSASTASEKPTEAAVNVKWAYVCPSGFKADPDQTYRELLHGAPVHCLNDQGHTRYMILLSKEERHKLCMEEGIAGAPGYVDLCTL
ncbi:MAG: hypothetical protein WBF33_08540 [Candidatus Nitrosopolaris sp.]|jgi:hypothetical protein